MIGFKLSTGDVISLDSRFSVEFELESSLFGDDIAGGRSTPLKILDIDGNYKKLGFANRIDKLARIIVHENVQMLVDGKQEYVGKLFVKRSSSKGITGFYIPNGFAADIVDKNLVDVNYGTDVNLGSTTSAIVTSANGYVTQNYPDVNFNFPSIYAPKLYDKDDARAWRGVHNTEDWSPQDYEVNEYVRGAIDSFGTYEIWRCILPATGGDPPVSSSTRWELQDGMALINNWDDTANEFRSNAIGDISTFNKYALSPQLYTKFIVDKIGGTYGYRITGDFMADPKTDQALTHNSVVLDRGEKQYYVRAEQDGVYDALNNPYAATGVAVIAHGINSMRFIFNDETTSPNEDADGIYDGGSNSSYTIQTAGFHIFRIEVTITHNTMFGSPYLNLYMPVTGTVINSTDNYRIVPSGHTGLAQYEFEYDAPASVVGNAVEWRLGNIVGSEYIAIDAGSFTVVENYAANNMNRYLGTVTLADHVPDVTVSDYLIGLKRRFNLNVIIDPKEKTIRLDYAKELLESTPTDFTDKIQEPVLEFKEAEGVTIEEEFKAGIEVQDGFGITIAATVNAIQDLEHNTYDYDVGDVVHAKANNTLYQLSIRNSVSRRWMPLGNYYPKLVYGNGKKTLSMIGQPTNSECLHFDSDYIVVPRMDIKGSSDLFGMGRNECPLMFSFWHGMQRGYNGTIEFPMASAHPYTPNGSGVGDVDLRFESGSTSVWSLLHEAWYKNVDGSTVLISDAFLNPKNVFEWSFTNSIRLRYAKFIRKKLVYKIDQNSSIRSQIEAVKISP